MTIIQVKNVLIMHIHVCKYSLHMYANVIHLVFIVLPLFVVVAAAAMPFMQRKDIYTLDLEILTKNHDHRHAGLVRLSLKSHRDYGKIYTKKWLVV